MTATREIPPRVKQTFFWTLVFSLAAHAYIYFSFVPSHDSMSCLLQAPEGAVPMALGRFMHPVYWLFRGCLPAPWLIGFLSILYLAAASCFIFSTLGFNNRVCIVLLCGIFSTNLTVTATNATYEYTADLYMLALLMASAGVWLWERYPRGGMWAAMPLFTMSMGLYQAYIDAAIGLALLLLIRRTVDGERFPALLRRAVKYAASLLGGAALYFALVMLLPHLTGIPMASGYNGLGHLLGSDLSSVVKLIPGAYDSFLRFFFGDRSYNPLALRLGVLVLGVLGVIRWVGLIRRRHIRGRELAFLLFCAALLPLGLHFVYVLSLGIVHELMMFSCFFVYVALLLPFELDGGQTASRPAVFGWRLTAVLCALVVLHNVVYANGAYYYKQLLYESSSQYAFSIVERIESDPAYEPGVTPVVILGSFDQSALTRSSTASFEQYRHVIGMESAGSFTYKDTFEYYCQSALGRSIRFVRDADVLADLTARPEVQKMPVFPKEGYCQMVGDVMVVKISG